MNEKVIAGVGVLQDTLVKQGVRNRYLWDLAAAGTFNVFLDGTTLRDTYLRVYDAENRLVCENDDSGGNLDSRIERYFAAGQYFVEAGSYLDRYTGDYKLSVAMTANYLNGRAIAFDGATDSVVDGGVTKSKVLGLVGSYLSATIIKIYDGQKLIGDSNGLSVGEWKFENGVWNFKTAALADGVHNLTVQFVSADRVVTQQSLTVTVDTQVVGSILAPSQLSSKLTADANLPLSGTAEVGSTVKIYDNNTWLGDAVLNGTQWSYSVPHLSLGSHTVTARITDLAGNSMVTNVLPVVISQAVTTVGQNKIGHIRSGESVEYALNLETAQTLRISTHGLSLSDSYLKVYDDKKQLVTFNDNGVNGLDAVIQWTFNPGKYTIAVSGRDASAGSYDLSVDKVGGPAGKVSIAGTVAKGQWLTASNTLRDPQGVPAAGTAGAVTYQWLADGQAIAGETNAIYQVSAAVVGKAISVRASYTDNAGTSESAVSDTLLTVNALKSGNGAIFEGTAPPLETVFLSVDGRTISVLADATGHWRSDWSQQALLSAVPKVTVSARMTDGSLQTQSQHMLVSDAVTNRIASFTGSSKLQVNFYSSRGLLTLCPEEVAIMGGLGIDYAGGNALTAQEWQTMKNWGIKTPYSFPVQNAATLQLIYDMVYKETKAVLQDPVKNAVVSTWYAPEEVRYWSSVDDMTRLGEVRRAIRDAERDFGNGINRPIEEYQPNHADVGRLDSFHGYFDVIAKGAYASVGDVSLLSSINAAAQTVVTASRGNGVVGGDFTPYLALGAYVDPVQGMTLEGFNQTIRAGFYTALAQGIQGLNVWSYALRSGFSAAWRDAYTDAYAALATEVNVILPELGQAIAKGQWLDGLTLPKPVNLSTADNGVVTGSFYANGHIYQIMVNTNLTQTAHLNLSSWGDFSKFKEVLIPTESTWQNSAAQIFDLAPQAVRVFEFIDPTVPSEPQGLAPSFAEVLPFVLQQAIAGRHILSVEALGIQDAGQRGDTNLTIQVWGHDGFGVSSVTDDYFYKVSAPNVSITQFTLAELKAGQIGLYYAGHQQAAQWSLKVTDDQSLTSGWKNFTATFNADAAAHIIFGDSSGDGGRGGYQSGNGGDGGGGADALRGGAFGDIIFGDGSGGGEGPFWGSGRATGTAGRGGGGNDLLEGMAGNDILFGDGFAGTENPYSASSGAKGIGTLGGYGGAGSGGGNVIGSIGGGAGGGNWDLQAQSGNSSTFGVLSLMGTYSANSHLFPGSGQGVSAGVVSGNDTEAVSAYLNPLLYAQVLNDMMQGVNADSRPFSQVMGAGSDLIDGGAGNDWVMGGYGNDILIGGQGNDVMWGRGGAVSASATLPADDDVFVWRVGDAGIDGAVDTIKDFQTWDGSHGDRIVLGDLLQSFNSTSSNISEWLTLQTGQRINGVNNSSKLTVDVDGAGAGQVLQVIELQGVNWAGQTIESLWANGVIREARIMLNITSDKTQLKLGEVATIRFSFSDLPRGFGASDVIVSNGVLSNFAVTTDSKVYTAKFTPQSQLAGNIATVCVDEGGYTDLAGKNGGGYLLSDIYIDTVAPVLTITSSTTKLKVNETALLTFSFTEVPVDFTADDVSVSNGTLSGLAMTTNPKVYSALFTPAPNLGSAMASVSVGAGAYTDVAGNNGMASNLLDISIDTSAPVLTIASNKMMLKAGETASLTFSFNEIPVGFTASDVVVHNGALSGFAVTTDPKVYTATFRPTADLQAGSADVRVAAGTYADVQGNLGAASVLTGLKFDKVAPTLIITDDTSGMASTGRVTYTFSFSEDVGASFTQSDITTSLGAFNSLTKLNATQYTAVLTLPDSGRGTAVVDVMTGSFQDVAGNFNVADTLANSQAYVNAFALWQTAESNARTGDINALNTYSAEFSNYRENTSADGVANQLIEGKRLSQYINQVTGTDVVSDAEFRAGFTISGKAAAGVQATLGFRLDNDRTDGVDGADARVLRIGANDVNGDGKTDVTASYENNTGNWSLVFAAQSAALKQATHNTWGSGVHQLVVDTDGSGGKSGEEASRLFLVADGTASSNDRGTVQKNFSVQDQITKELFVYYYGDPDGAGVGLWTALDQGDNASSADVVTTNRDADSLSYGDWDYYSSVGNAASTQATASNTALHFVTNISAQIWEFHMATISNRQSWNDAAALAADHKIFNSNTSRQGSLAEAIALYAANFGADSSVGNSVGAVQALSNLGSTNSFNMAESNVPAGWTGYMWTAAPTPSGHAEISLSYGELNNTSYVNSSYATAVL